MFYGKVLHLIKHHKISLDELTEASVNGIYKRIIYQINDVGGKKNYSCILNKVLQLFVVICSLSIINCILICYL